jgi:hypothetical protein
VSESAIGTEEFGGNPAAGGGRLIAMGELIRPGRRGVLGLALLLGSVLAVVGAPQRARACSCMGWTDQQAFAEVDVVFHGRLVSNDLTEADSPATGGVVALRFAVERVFKGEALEQQTVLTPGDSSSCGFLGQVGLDYLVFAAAGETALIEIGDADVSTNLCAGTRVTSAEAAIPASFGTGVAPLPATVSARPPSAGAGTSLAWTAVLAAVALVGAGATIVTLRRH